MKFNDVDLALRVDGKRSNVYGFDISRKEHPLVGTPEKFDAAYAYQIEIPFLDIEPDWVSLDDFRRPVAVKCIFEKGYKRKVYDGAIVVYEESENVNSGRMRATVTVRVPIDFRTDRKWDEKEFLELLDWDLEPGIQPDELKEI